MGEGVVDIGASLFSVHRNFVASLKDGEFTALFAFMVDIWMLGDSYAGLYHDFRGNLNAVDRDGGLLSWSGSGTHCEEADEAEGELEEAHPCVRRACCGKGGVISATDWSGVGSGAVEEDDSGRQRDLIHEDILYH